MNIYRKIAQLDVTLNDEIRSVFDRLVASDDAIAAAQSMRGYVQLFATAEDAGMSPQMFEAYQKVLREAHMAAEDDLRKKLVNAAMREQQRWYREERKRVREQVAERVQGMRGYRALSILTRGQEPDGSDAEIDFKLDRDDLVRRRGADFLKQLPRPYVYRKEGGTDADIVAIALGYGSANEMLDDLVRLKSAPMRETIEIETDREMARRYPDPLLDGSVAQMALEAVYNDKQSEVLAAELRALKRKAREVRPFIAAREREERDARTEAREQRPGRDELQLIRASAREFIAQKAIRDVNPNNYRVAAAKASRAAYEAALKKDYATAETEKRREIVNNELFRAATQARKDTQKAQKYLRKFDRKATRQVIGKAGNGLLEHIDSILDHIDLRKISGAQIDREAARREIREAFDSGLIVADQSVIAALGRDRGDNWQTLSVSEFLGIRDVVKQIETLARREAMAIVNGERMMIQEKADEVAENILAQNKQMPIERGQETLRQRGKKARLEAVSTWLRPSSIARVLDNADFGPVTRYIIQPIRQAYASRLVPMEKKMTEDVAAIYQKHYSNKELARFNERQPVPELNDELSKSDMLSLALNWGNESNRSAVLGGVLRDGSPAYTEEGIEAVLARLDSRDYLFVQDIWDYLETYWPMLEQAERRRRGVAPQKIEATPFTVETADGRTVTLKGGYYPLHYDPRHSERQKEIEVEEHWKKMGTGMYVSANTRAGATHERVQNHGMVVRLGLRSIDQHLREIIRDITIGDEVNFVKKLLNNKTVRNAFVSTGNENHLRALELWLQDAAVGELPADGILDKSLAYIRTGFTKSKLAWNAITTVLQLTGAAQTAAVLGTQAFAQGVGRYAKSPVAAHQHIMEKSDFMRTRYQTMSWNKDVADTHRFLSNNTPFGKLIRTRNAMDRVSATYFWPIARTQMVIDEITWLGAYWKGINEKGLAPDAAIGYADAQVEAAQTSGFFSDRSGLERGTIGYKRTRQAQFVRIWTTLISYMLAKGNIAYEKGRQFGRKPTLTGAVHLATDLMLLFVVEAMMTAVIYGRWPDDDDEDQSMIGFIATETGLSIASTVPFVRDIPSSRFGGGNTPLGALMTDIFRAETQLMQALTEEDQVDLSLLKSLNNVGGTLFHYPSAQSNRAIEAYWREHVEEEDVAPYEYLTGSRDDD